MQRVLITGAGGGIGRSLRETAPRWDFGYTFVAILMAIACAFFRACHEQELDCRRFGRARSARSKQRVHASLARQVGAASPHRAGRPSRILFADRRVPRQRQELQSFTAIGVVKEGAPYQVDMGDGFSPFRRDVTWQTAAETPIRTLLEQLEFTKGNRNWGYQLRSGLAEISELDMLRIARAMGASLT